MRPERLTFSHGDDVEGDAGEFEVTVTFAAQAGKTLLTMRSCFVTAEARAKVVEFGAIEGGLQTLARLAEHLAAHGNQR